jgi:hypothetical protein
MVWFAARGPSAFGGGIYDSERDSFTKRIQSFSTAAQNLELSQITSVSSSGFSLGPDNMNGSGQNYVAWTFRKAAPKFFDIVTYTGTGVNRTVAHNLGSVPGCIIVKRTSSTEDWAVYHRSLNGGVTPYNYFLRLNATLEETNNTTRWVQAPTATDFTVGTHTEVNTSGQTYVAYLFAHDAGGFGDDGEQNVISCGSYTGTGGTTTPLQVTLGYEPQWVLVKPSSAVGNWAIADTMRGATRGSDGASFFNELLPNSSGAENANNYGPAPTATGFAVSSGGFPNASGTTYIYIAIRRGPMKTPEAGTEVFAVNSRTANSPAFPSGFPVDLAWLKRTNGSDSYAYARLTQGKELALNATTAEAVATGFDFDYMTGYRDQVSASAIEFSWMFQRAPGFMDVVAYTGTGVARTVAHNLGVVPEMIIGKRRNNLRDWSMYAAPVGNDKGCAINDNASFTSTSMWNEQTPTNSVFYVNGSTDTNQSGDTYIAYLFATLAGVSDIGTYTGNGTSVSVTTGFQPRFILVKRTDSTGNWIVGDSARGLVAGNDPALFLNTTAAETTGQDWVDVSATGFTVNETALNANVNTGTYIYLAIS